MAFEIEGSSVICTRCGTAFGTRKSNFPASHCVLYNGIGYLPYCKNCIDSIYNDYMKQCGDPQKAVRQLCRKLDLYWNQTIFDSVIRRTTVRTILSGYLQRINNIAYAGKSYDDTLKEEGSLWEKKIPEPMQKEPEVDDEPESPSVSMDDIPDDVIAYWGPGYTPDMYLELDRRLQYYRAQMNIDGQLDMGAEAILRQITMMEIDINKARRDGRSVDKMVNSLNSLISTLNRPTKSAATDSATANTPFGVWIKRWEDERPVPEIDESMKDVDGIIKYVLTWVYGHLAHMLKIKNARTPMYDDAIAKLRVEHPEYEDEDDEPMLYDLFGDGGGDAISK